ncbi:MAG: polysaccharide biosynthesis/export family protein [Vicinamibacterales bacterium]
MTVFVLFLIAGLQQPPTQRPAASSQGSSPASPAQQADAPATPSDYVVGPQDVLAISVYGVADLTREVTVDQDGTFDFPMLGRVQAGGRGVRDIETDIAARMVSKGYFTTAPSVSVSVRTYRSQTVWVMGAVRSGGAQTIAGNASLMTVLGEAGLTTDSGRYIFITHRPTNASAAGPVDQNANTIKVSRKDLESGRAQNIPLRDGDTIYVATAEHYLISGYVHAPGSYELEDNLTVFQAVARAGGAIDLAAKNRITITRMQNGQAITIKVKDEQTELVEANDTIFVPRRRM